MAVDRNDTGAETGETASHEAFLTRLFTRASTLAFLAISGAVTAIALGYTPLLEH
jgi:hypothetical protein